MATRSVQESSLTSLADAIRAKGGTSDTLTFPGGFVSAVEAIDAGGGGDDGSLRQSSSARQSIQHYLAI